MKNPGMQDYYDPIIEGEAEQDQLQLRGIVASDPGLYILFEDFIAAIEQYAFGADKPSDQRAIYDLLDWLESTFINQDSDQQVVAFDKSQAERIELYPDSDDKWHARLIDHDGWIIGEINNGDFNRDFVEQDAMKKYPELEIIQLESEQDDSTWNHKGPSKRIWGKR